MARKKKEAISNPLLNIFEHKIVGWPYVIKEKGASVWKVVNVENKNLTLIKAFPSKELADKHCKELRKTRSIPENGVSPGDKLEPVVSSNIHSVGKSKEGLIVEYSGGSIYLYPDQEKHLEPLLKSASKGSYVIKNIRNLYFIQLY